MSARPKPAPPQRVSPPARKVGRKAVNPPLLAEHLLALTLPNQDWRDSVLGDLREEFGEVRSSHGMTRASRWYWGQALAVGGRVLRSRLRLRQRSERAWVTPPEQSGNASWSAGLIRDVRHAVRTLLRRPATSAVIVITLAFALATNSTSYAILDSLVLRPFRFPDVDRLVVIISSDPQSGLIDKESVATADFRDWRREARTVTQMSAAEWWDANLSGIDDPEQVAGYKVTADFFAALGAQPVIGRSFVADEETPGNHRRAILGHALWERLFAADPSLVGRTVRVDGEPYEVVGIAPPGFSIPDGAQIWSPLAYTSEQWNNRRNRNLVAIARLADGVSIHEARAEIGSIAERLRREYPETNASAPNGVVTFTRGMSDPGAGAFLTTMVAASVLLLLIACANIANLLLARGSERAQEFAVRLAMGASRRRLACQLMIEGGLLASFAVLLALPLAAIGLSLSRASLPPSIIRFVPGWQYLQISPTVFAATAAFAATATLAFALVPALQTIRPEVADTLRQSSRSTTAPRRRHWLRTALASAQVALTLALLFGSGLLLTAADGAINGSLGYDKQNLLVARLVLPERPYADTERRRQFINGVLDRIRQIPAVSSASMISNLPYAGGNTSREFYPDGAPLEPRDVRTVHYRRVASGYFETMRIPLLAGRALTEADREDAQQVAVVSRSLADRYWPNGDAVGRQFRVAREGHPITVVGVVGDILHDWFQQQRHPTAYRPLGQEAPFAHAFVVRTIGEPTGLAGDLRRAVRAMDADQPVIAVRSMEQHVEERAAGLSFIARALAVVAFIALVVAIMGLYSLMAFIASRRTQELGVRMALGATQWQVIGVTSRQGLRITFAGLFIGSIAAAAVGRLMEAVLLGIVSPSVWQLAALIAVVAAVSALACYIPARRTANLDPTIALRAD